MIQGAGYYLPEPRSVRQASLNLAFGDLRYWPRLAAGAGLCHVPEGLRSDTPARRMHGPVRKVGARVGRSISRALCLVIVS